MRRIPILLAISLTALALAAAGCGDDEGQQGDRGPTANTGPATTEATTTGSAGGTEATDEDDVIEVSMKDILFKPETANVRVGQVVRWVNDDPIDHTATATEGADFDSGAVSAGETFEWKAERATTVKYFCEIHPNQKGTLIIQA